MNYLNAGDEIFQLIIFIVLLLVMYFIALIVKRVFNRTDREILKAMLPFLITFGIVSIILGIFTREKGEWNFLLVGGINLIFVSIGQYFGMRIEKKLGMPLYKYWFGRKNNR